MMPFLAGVLIGATIATVTLIRVTRRLFPRVVHRMLTMQAETVRNETEIGFYQAIDVAVNAAIAQAQITGTEMGAGMFQVLMHEALHRADEVRQGADK